MISNFFRMFKSGFSSFIRNGWLSIASITIMLLTLLILSMFFMINVALSTGIKSIQEKIDISVYLKENIKQSTVVDMQYDLAALKDVKSVNYISKDDAMVKFKQQNANNKTLLDSVASIGNSLPASFEVKVYNPDKLDTINTELSQKKYKEIIDKISYQDNKSVIQSLLRATNYMRAAGIGITLVFSLISLIIIFNTIRIAIYSRMEEIEIMKLVGATPGFIKGPFLIEGAIYGFFATVLSIAMMSSFIYFASPSLVSYFSDAGSSLSNYLADNLIYIAIIELLVGLIIGVFSSWLAIRKHLKIG